jgi:hypothetical protein
MKNLLAALALAWCVTTACAQDVYFHTWFTNWQPSVRSGEPYYSCTNTIEVGTNQILFPWTIDPNDMPHYDIYAEYPQGTIKVRADSFVYDPPMGPCRVRVEIYTYTIQTNTPALCLWRLVNVNTTPIPGMAVVPSGVVATLRLDTSTDLSSWQMITNANLPATNGNRFFRLSLSIP